MINYRKPFFVTSDGLIDAYGCLLEPDEAHEIYLAASVHLQTYSKEDVLDQNESAKSLWREIEARCPPRKQKSRLGYVYLILNKRTKLTKIGFSNKPEYREATLQSEEPEVELIGYKAVCIADEKEMHNLYASKRVRGEWFNLTEKDRGNILSL